LDAKCCAGFDQSSGKGANRCAMIGRNRKVQRVSTTQAELELIRVVRRFLEMRMFHRQNRHAERGELTE